MAVTWQQIAQAAVKAILLRIQFHRVLDVGCLDLKFIRHSPKVNPGMRACFDGLLHISNQLFVLMQGRKRVQYPVHNLPGLNVRRQFFAKHRNNYRRDHAVCCGVPPTPGSERYEGPSAGVPT